MVRFLLSLMVSLLFTGCLQPKRPTQTAVDTREQALQEEAKAGLLKADRDFSRLSAEKGYKTACLEYIDSNGVLLRPDMAPIIGAEAIDYLSQQADQGFTMTWEPRGGMVARSGELGYTFGLYSIKPKAQDTVIYGTYVNIWKKQADGTWKFMLDTGNEGVDITAQEPLPEF
jgi:ketosteroid isomerase-like protein